MLDIGYSTVDCVLLTELKLPYWQYGKFSSVRSTQSMSLSQPAAHVKSYTLHTHTHTHTLTHTQASHW